VIEEKVFIAASCKEWHRQEFECVQKRGPGEWVYVANSKELLQALESTEPRYIFFLHWNWRVPREIWSNNECVCFHMTDLPYGRGGSPLQNLIERGIKETKLTAFRMEEEMDTGAIYAKFPMPLSGRAEEIYHRAGGLSWEIISTIIESEPDPVPQEGQGTIFSRRKPEQSELPLQGGLEELYDHIRMLDAPTYPLAYIKHGNFQMELSHASFMGDEIRASVVIRKNPNEKESS
tara:strand:+ start:233 stop:934 length:702 start_codon:yes stop_codon:yes gene_type:complete